MAMISADFCVARPRWLVALGVCPLGVAGVFGGVYGAMEGLPHEGVAE